MRIKFVRNLLILLFLGVLARLFYWQVIKADELKAQAESQHFELLRIEAKRGDISFADNFVLASSKPTYLLYGLPKVLSADEKAKVASTLTKVLADKEDDVVKKELLKNLEKDLYWVPLKKNLPSQIKEKIEDLKLKGLGFEQTSSRFYPEGSSSAHLLGFVASNARGEDTGYFGLEGFYNGELKGIPGTVRFEKDAFGLPILTGQFLEVVGKNGKDLILNVDRTVQFILERHLKKGIEKYGAQKASAIVMDPLTGSILGAVAYPNYDPASFDKFPKEYYKNPAVSDSYEPGSTFKVFVMAAAINEKVVTPETRCDICSGPQEIGGFLIRTWNNKYHPDTSMIETIVNSDNTGMVFVSRQLGLDKMYTYLQNFGLGQPTNIDLEDEDSPNLRLKGEWREIDLATASFGQGIALTPIQMVTAVSAIANGGYVMEPHVVKEIKDEESLFVIKPKIKRQVISQASAKIITEMMVEAVDEGEAKFAKPKGFRIAGKTGTAQIPLAGHYDPNKTIASFVGFAPADNPKFVMLVRYDQPTASPYGSETAAPTFFEIAKELFSYYKIAPT